MAAGRYQQARLGGAVLVKTHDEWQVSDRRYLSEGSMALLTMRDREEVAPKELPSSARRSQ